MVFGTKNGFPDPLPLSGLNGINGVEFDGVAAHDNTGFSVAVGDVNGDGISDLITSAPYSLAGGGSVYVVFGKTSGWSSTATALNASFLNGVNGAEFDGAAGSYAGRPVAAGDVNGDGIADLIISIED